MTDRTAVLSSSPLFAELDGRERAELAGMLRPFGLGAEEVLFRQGTPADRMFIVTSGRLAVHLSSDGTRAPLPDLGVDPRIAVLPVHRERARPLRGTVGSLRRSDKSTMGAPGGPDAMTY